MSRVKALLRENGLALLVIAALVVGYVMLRTPSTDIASAEAFVARLAQGSPSVIEFFSNS